MVFCPNSENWEYLNYTASVHHSVLQSIRLSVTPHNYQVPLSTIYKLGPIELPRTLVKISMHSKGHVQVWEVKVSLEINMSPCYCRTLKVFCCQENQKIFLCLTFSSKIKHIAMRLQRRVQLQGKNSPSITYVRVGMFRWL